MARSQGFIGALDQYWTVEEKPRLDRRNTFFEDYPQPSNWDALKFGIISITLTIVIISVSMVAIHL